MSGSVTISDQRSYIKIETLRGKNPTEIHGALSEDFHEFTVDRCTVSCWANRFRGGCVSKVKMTQDQEGREHQQMKEV